MSDFPERRRALVDAAFATFGEDAVWAGRAEPARVRFKQEGREAGYGGITVLGTATLLRVRSWDVGQPAIGDVVELAAGDNAGRYAIVDQPVRDAKGVWSCRFEQVQP